MQSYFFSFDKKKRIFPISYLFFNSLVTLLLKYESIYINNFKKDQKKYLFFYKKNFATFE